MPQFDYLGSWDDSWMILDAILKKNGIHVIPDLWYEEPTATSFSTLNNELETVVQKKRRVYLWSEDFARVPPFLQRQNEGTMAGKYSIRPDIFGPVISLTLPACQDTEGLLNLRFGILSYQPESLNPEHGA